MSKHPLPKKTSSEPKKKKRWISILSPKEFNSIQLGETLCFLPNEILGRKVIANLMYLTNDPKKQHINIKFKVNEVKGDTVSSEFVGYEISNSFIKRVVRKGRDKVDDSLTAQTKDNINIKLKPLLVAKHKIKGSISTDLRKSSREFLSNAVKSLTYQELINSIIYNKLQKDLRTTLNKIYPLSVCEIRVLERL